ncbi:hypothetical protein [Campylobacter sp. RM16190]|nr:hypothetical protein [Campylobacter sp. RM16190]
MNLATIPSKKFEFKSTKSDKFADFAKSIEIFKKEPIMAKVVDVQGSSCR